MDILYRSTRSNAAPITASKAILQGLSPDGGLFVPETMPVFDKPFSELAEMSYQDLAYEVMSKFFTDFPRRSFGPALRTPTIRNLIRRRSLRS